jgi:TetR/AcrR family transcriptional repressor of nem operon
MTDIIVNEGLREPLRQAMSLFWDKGVANTSYPDIVLATGLSRKALYANWPDKNALVSDALALYRDDNLMSMLAVMAPAGAVGLDRFWTKLSEAVGQPGWTGCFLYRSASGELRRDPTVQKIFHDFVGQLRSTILGCIRIGQAEGQIDANLDPETASWQAVSVLSMISAFGGMSGDGPQVRSLLASGRRACGLSA